MKRSTGVRTDTVFLTEGRGGLLSGRKDQCLRSSSVAIISARDRTALDALASDHSAPASIQRLSSLICAADNGSPFEGIRSSLFFEETSLIRRLSPACPGTMAFPPDSPVLNAPSFVSNRNPPFCFSGP